MSEKDSKQTLISSDDDEEWQKAFRGEVELDPDNETHQEAQQLRQYILSTELEAAERSVPPSDALTIITPEEARVEYRRASAEIHKRANTGWSRWIAYGLVALFGVMAGLVAFFAAHFFSNPAGDKTAISANGSQISTQSFGDQYRIIFDGKPPGNYPNMLPIPAGRFTMGCSIGWDDVVGGCRDNEYPAHKVTIKAFELAQHEVTVGQYRRFADESGYQTVAEAEERGCVIADPKSPAPRWIMDKASSWRSPGFAEQDDTHPAVCLARKDAQAYITWLNQKTKKRYRLPTEAEWEYAARAGTATPYYWGNQADQNLSNFEGVTGGDRWEYTSPVGSFPANNFGLQDMLGNAWEWVSDCWHESYAAAPIDGSSWESNCNGNGFITRRGGAWDALPKSIRSAYRNFAGGTDRSQGYGFRVAHDMAIIPESTD